MKGRGGQEDRNRREGRAAAQAQATCRLSCELRDAVGGSWHRRTPFIYRHFCGTPLNAVVEILQREEYLEPLTPLSRQKPI